MARMIYLCPKCGGIMLMSSLEPDRSNGKDMATWLRRRWMTLTEETNKLPGRYNVQVRCQKARKRTHLASSIQCWTCREFIGGTNLNKVRAYPAKAVGHMIANGSKYDPLRRRFGVLLECAGRMQFFLTEIIMRGEHGLSLDVVNRAKWVHAQIHKLEDSNAEREEEDDQQWEQVGGSGSEPAVRLEPVPHDHADGGPDDCHQGPADSQGEGDAGLRGGLDAG